MDHERFDSRNLDLDIEEHAELWEELEENCDADPDDGITLIRKDKFIEYAQEYADETGAFTVVIRSPRTFQDETIDLSQEWPFRHIDWEAAAEELEEDWFEIEFDGNTYLAR
jgi:hypothetical protein